MSSSDRIVETYVNVEAIFAKCKQAPKHRKYYQTFFFSSLAGHVRFQKGVNCAQ